MDLWGIFGGLLLLGIAVFCLWQATVVSKQEKAARKRWEKIEQEILRMRTHESQAKGDKSEAPITDIQEFRRKGEGRDKES